MFNAWPEQHALRRLGDLLGFDLRAVGDRAVEVLLRSLLEQRGDHRPGRSLHHADAVLTEPAADSVDEGLNRVL